MKAVNLMLYKSLYVMCNFAYLGNIMYVQYCGLPITLEDGEATNIAYPMFDTRCPSSL